MQYQKQVMNLSELKNMGLSESFLRNAFANKDQTFAWRSNPAKRNSPILFDTSGLESYRLAQIELVKNSTQHQNIKS